jgi:lysophospholipase L1-like esterase
MSVRRRAVLLGAAALALAARAAAGTLLALGSSSVARWHSARADLGLPVVNRGIGGAQLPDLLRAEETLESGLAPTWVLVYGGDNDLGLHRPVKAVADDYGVLLARLHARWPRARILALSVKPSLQRVALMAQMRQLNERIAAHATALGGSAVYLDVFTPMLGDDGLPRSELFIADGLHMSAAGYAVWADAVKAHLG